MDETERELHEHLTARLTWNTPLASDHADRLLDHLDARPQMRVLDLGCGWGELMLRLLAKVPDTTAEGVDHDPLALDRGRRNASSRGLSARVKFTSCELPRFESTADRVICIGASHVWGGPEGAFRAVRRHLSPGGKALVGDGFWRKPPSPKLVEMMGDLAPSLADFAACATAAGFRPVFMDTATDEEWDEFEWGTYRGLEEVALSQRSSELASRARDLVDLRRREYLEGYRGVLGFAYLVLENQL